MIKHLVLFFFMSSFFLNAQEYLKMISLGSYSVEEIQEEAEAYFEGRDKGKGTGYKQYKRWEFNALRMQDERGNLKSDRFYVDELESYNSKKNARLSSSLKFSTGDWEELGPFFSKNTTSTTTDLPPGLGRLTSIAVEETNTNHIIVGSDTGGVWRTTNKGGNWDPLNDTFSNMKVFSLAIDPQNPNVYYWGSDSGRIYKSENAGASWDLLETISFGSVVKILIHPTDTNIIYAACEYDNLYKSKDGGKTWDVKIPFLSQPAAFDVEFKPGDPNTVYVSGRFFHKSTDGGESFKFVFGFDRKKVKMMAVSPADPNVVFVLEENNGKFGALYKSTNAGRSFRKIRGHRKNYLGGTILGNDTRGQAPRDMDIVVSNTNINEVHIAGINTWRSLDGGRSFQPSSSWLVKEANSENIGYCHADVDIMLYIGNEIFLGTDGGIYIAENPAADLSRDYYTDISSGLGIMQFYRIGVSQTSPVVVSAGAQDNGTSYYREQENEWRLWGPGDGTETFVDKADTATIYGSSQLGRIYRKNGMDYTVLSQQDGAWVTPIDEDPIEPNTFYVGYQSVQKFSDSGSKRENISQILSSFPLKNVDVAPTDNRTIYASENDELYKTNDGGATNWEMLTNSLGVINDIAVHPSDPNKIALATTDEQKIFISEDGGETWSSVKYDLPSFTALCLVWQDSDTKGLYVGMNYGVYFLEDGATTWNDYRSNLPNVIVNELEINTADDHLYAATYGRGVWRTPIVKRITEDEIDIKINSYPNPVKNNLSIKWDGIKSAEIIVFNREGKIVYYSREKALGETSEIKLSHLIRGIYFLTINANGRTIKQKIIKE